MRQTRDWENQYITQKNRYPMHTPYGAYETVEQALAGNRNASRFVMDLNGDWKFKMYPSPEAVEAFYEENFDHAAWDAIPVPSNWELKGFGDGEEKKGLMGLFKKAGNRLESMKAQYGKVEANVEKIAQSLEQHQITLLKDVAMFDQMYELNLKYYKELTMYILAGKKRLEEVRSGELEELRKKAEQSGTAEDAQAYNDLVNLCNRFEKKIHDLELTRMVSVQMGPQTRLLQNNDTLMIEKIQSSLVNTIPLWKSQMVLALGLEHSRQATADQSAVTEMTNELLKKNADTLKMGTIATAKEAERSIVDIETLQHTNQQLIESLDEVARIQQEGAAKRREAEAQLGRIEGELKQKLLELRG